MTTIISSQKMAPNNPIEQLFSKILTVSQSAYQIPQATRNDQIYLQFNSPPTISDDEEDEGMWLVNNLELKIANKTSEEAILG